MNKFKILSIVACVTLCMGFASCEKDEPQDNVIEFLDITLSSEVDMGLPSGTIWANKNVGATSPEEYGGYYAWGETNMKDEYGYSTYSVSLFSPDFYDMNGSISGTQYDVARCKWGENWRMPTKVEFAELMTECYWQWGKYKGAYGIKITGPNCKSIFLPASGFRNGSSLYRYSEALDYWTASYKGYNVYGFHAYEWDSYTQQPLKGDDYLGSNIDTYEGCYGRSVRPVKSK